MPIAGVGEDVGIITDLDELRKIADIVENDEQKDATVERLLSYVTPRALGLSAPQVNIFLRAFYLRLTRGHYIFINPRLSFPEKEDWMTSTEGCLSIPGQFVAIERHHSVALHFDQCFSIKNGTELKGECPKASPWSLFGQDAFVAQHEYDHLEGVLMLDYPAAPAKEAPNKDSQRAEAAKARRGRTKGLFHRAQRSMRLERQTKLKTKTKPAVKSKKVRVRKRKK